MDYGKRDTQIREQCFKGHVAEYSILRDDSGNEVERLQWGKPDTSIYCVHYLRYSQVLFVTGDLGEAVYEWNELVTLEWIAGLDLQYFAGKCQASEVGRRFTDWEESQAAATLDEFFAEGRDAARKRFAETCVGENPFGSRDGCRQWLAAEAEEVYDIFGDAWYEWLPDIGSVIARRCQSHLVGLKMAMEVVRK